MLLRILTALAVIAGSVRAQEIVASGDDKAGRPQYWFFIRAISAPDRLIDELRPEKRHESEKREESVPFDGWMTLNRDQNLILRKAESRISHMDEFTLVTLSDQQMRHLIKGSRQGENSGVLFGPKAKLSSGEIGTIKDQSEIQYLPSQRLQSESSQSAKVSEGTQITMRASLLDDGRTQADVELRFSGTSERDNVGVNSDKVAHRTSEFRVTVVDFSVILSGDEIHTAVLPSQITVGSAKPERRIKLASRVIGRRPAETEDFRQIVWVVTVANARE
jgi:hypothetical protein